ncbi:hypothetical protein, partial [Streptomyces koyangensis]|uniref:hypothetical protein n=1 Tax=Streptomyces koyangensis TaxID=188770 RepID=UPI003BF55A95
MSSVSGGTPSEAEEVKGWVSDLQPCKRSTLRPAAYPSAVVSVSRCLEVISFGEPAVADESAGDAGEGEEVVGLAFVA